MAILQRGSRFNDGKLIASQEYVDDHSNKKNNPHSVTKSQVGLGSVQNYGIATKAEAESGSANNKYITPLRAKEAISKLETIGVSLVLSNQVIQYNLLGASPSPTTTQLQANVYGNSEADTGLFFQFFSRLGTATAWTSMGVASSSKTTNISVPSQMSQLPLRYKVEVRRGSASGAIIATDYVELVGKTSQAIAGTNVTISGNTISAVNTTYSNATTSASGLMSSTDKSKLNGIATGANNYTHPSSHPASMITESSTKRFVTDTEKSTWNAKQNALTAGSNVTISGDTISAVNTTYGVATTSSNGLMASGDKTKLDGIAAGANKYSHPSSHPASMITESTSQRFVSDSEKSTWNAKASTSTATTSADGLMSSSDKSKLNGIATGAQVNRTIATQAQAEAGTDNSRDMTPLRTKQAIEKLAPTPPLASASVNGLMASADKVKLDGIATGANNYTHPSSHPASMITESASKRFVSDTEKSTWNGKQNTLTAGSNITISGNTISATNTTYGVATTSANGLMAAADKSKLNGIATGANNYTHPSTHPASMITESSTKRFVSDSEKKEWNNYHRGNWDSVQFKVNGNANTYYPVTLTGLNMNEATMSFLEIYRSYSWEAPSTWNTSTHKGGLNLSIDYSLAGWGGQNYELQLTLSQTYSKMVADVITAQPDTSTIIVWLRGGTALYELRRQSKDVRVTVYDGVQNALPYKNMGGTQYENVYNSKTAIEPWFNFTGIKKLLTTEDKLYIGGGYRNPKNSVEIYHENNKPTKADIGLGNVNNTSDLNKPISTATQNALNGKVDNAQVLTNVPANAKFTDTVYSHPSSHPASMITETSSKRFVSDTEKSTWNGKQNSLTAGSNITISGSTISATNTTYSVATTSANGLMSSTDKSKLNGIATGANNYTHPSSHPASIITQNSSNRFVTDTEKSTWNGKQNKLTAGSNITISGNTISSTNTTYSVATTSANGLMSSSDKSKLNGIAAGANNDTIKDQRTGNQTKFWTGTQAQYNAIGTKDANTLYVVSG